MRNKENVWIFTFEYAGVAKVGGLGEVPANQAENLTNFYNFTVFMPSHGQIERFKDAPSYEKLPIECIGKFEPSLLEEKEERNVKYRISYHKITLNGVDILLLSGENTLTKKYLDDDNVYNPDTKDGKFYLYAQGMKSYIKKLIQKDTKNLPNVIHLHDHHVVLPFFNIKQELYKNNIDIPSIITIHLLTYPRKGLDFYKFCGIDDTPINMRFKEGFKSITLKQLFKLANNNQKEKSDGRPPTIEKIGALISDLVTSVSESYLQSDVIPECGGELIEFKSDFVWDGCDWQYEELLNDVLTNHEDYIRRELKIPKEHEITQKDMKKYLLTYKIGNLAKSPLIRSEKVLKAINEISDGNQFIKNGGRIKVFDDSGPLAISTGRVSPQKGFDVILESIPKIIEKIPKAKFLLLILPTDYSIEEIKEYSKYVKKYPDNLRIIFGIAPDVFNLAHLASDVYCALSRWEPFGIMALEAMASKMPVVASKVGGLQETILDLRKHTDKGTGFLIEKDNKHQFIEAMVNIFLTAQIYEKSAFYDDLKEDELNKMREGISYEELRAQLEKDPQYFTKIKQYCYNRVENHFRWRIVSKKLINLYTDIQKIHKSQDISNRG
ncbi:MAG: GDP-mannose-dependent alpha-(1-6)-phosphatidylinositol monomannoside mannosyltransferase [Promethearchaeota archaeon]|nr:MAG: GDP-mannose-dependent alpha-(1-6)-phosphatidylinositol monomannoside mannosyltransferase [Candidatus Lokiarchaeota archaeon]